MERPGSHLRALAAAEKLSVVIDRRTSRLTSTELAPPWKTLLADLAATMTTRAALVVNVGGYHVIDVWPGAGPARRATVEPSGLPEFMAGLLAACDGSLYVGAEPPNLAGREADDVVFLTDRGPSPDLANVVLVESVDVCFPTVQLLSAMRREWIGDDPRSRP